MTSSVLRCVVLIPCLLVPEGFFRTVEAFTLTAHGSFAASGGEPAGFWEGEFSVEQSFFRGRVWFPGVQELPAELEVIGSFGNGTINFGSATGGSEQLTFSGSWNRADLVAGAFTYGSMTGAWTGRWGSIRPGRPADSVVEEYAEALPIFSGTSPRPAVDPGSSAYACHLLEDRRVMALISGGGEAELRRRCARIDGSAKRESGGSRIVYLLDSVWALFSTAYAQLMTNRANNPAPDPYPIITQNEVSVAASGLNANLVVVGYNDTSHSQTGTSRVGYSTSPNAGVSWNDRGPLPAGTGNGICCDPVLGSDLSGVFYFASLGNLSAVPRILVSRSFDGGLNFQVPPVNASPAFVGEPDKPEMAIDRSLSSLYSGNIYVCWSDFSDGNGGIRFSRSTNGGASYLQVAGSLSAGLFSMQGCAIAVSTDGVVYLSWWDGGTEGGYPANTIRFRRSINGGVSFQPEIALGSAIPPPSGGCCNRPHLNGNVRNRPFANLAADPLIPGNVYLTWNTYTSGSSEVFFRRSTGYGIDGTWSLPVRLNDVTTGDQFMPRVASGILYEADPDTSIVRVTWYDRRDDPLNAQLHLYADASTDGGATWRTDSRITTVASPIPAICPTNFDCDLPECYFGDYNAVASRNPIASDFILGWGDTRDTDSGGSDCAGGTSSADPNVYTAVGC